jgi:quinol monooxygenase YgiN
MKTDKLITYVELTVNPDYIETVLPLADKTRNAILLEEGCENFMLMRKPDEPNVLVIFAIYTSKQTYDWNLEQEYVVTFFAFLEGKLMKKPSMHYLEGL